MKRLHLLKSMLLLCALIVGSGTMWGDTATLPNTQALTTSFADVGSDTHIQIKTSSANDYTNPLRFYANNTITIKAAEGYVIQSVTYEASATGNYVTYAQQATVTPSVTPSVSGKNVTWSYTTTVTEFTFKPSSQTRANSMTITYAAESTDPAIKLNKTSLIFGEVEATSSKEMKFTVTPSNLESDLTISCANTKYEISPKSIAANKKSAQTITVTANPTSTNDDMDGTVIISGGGLANNGEVSLSTTVIRKASGLAYTPTSVTLTQGDSFEVPAFSKAEGISFSSIAFSSSYNEVATVSNEGVISLGSSTGTAIIKATFAQSDVYTAGEATCTITVNPTGVTPEPSTGYYEKVTSVEDLTDGDYLIVYEDGELAMDGDLATVDATSNTINVTFDTNNIEASNDTQAAEFEIKAITGGHSIKSKSHSYYIGQTSDANGLATNTSTPYVNTISFVNGDANIVSGEAYLRYNSASNQLRFRYYKSSSYTNQKAIQLYKKVAGANPDNIDIFVSEAGFATYVSGYDLDYSSNANLKAYIAKKVENDVKMVEVEKVEAGTGVLLHATDGGGKNYTVNTTDETTDNVTGNLFIAGNDEAVQSTDDSNHNNYILNIVNNKIGFYKAAGQNVAKNRAYLQTTVDASRISLIFDDETTGINAIENGEKATENAVIYNLNGQRVANPSKGLYIVNGKKVIINK